MSIIELILVIALLGLLVWGIQKLIPMSEPFKNGIYVLSVVLVVFLIVNAIFGIGPKIDLLPASWRGGKG